MELFGFKVERIKPEELVEQATVHKLLGEQAKGGYVPLERKIAKQGNPVWDRIRWPDDSHLTNIQQLGYMNRKLKWLSRDFFSVCIFYELESLRLFTYIPATTAIYEELKFLHCMDYCHMPPEILLQLPEHMSQIFQEGRSATDTARDITPARLT